MQGGIVGLHRTQFIDVDEEQRETEDEKHH